MILHIPHASRVIPPDCRGSLLLDGVALERELDAMTDAFTDELFACAGSASIIFPVSRLVVDAERFPVDADEPMAAAGMGVIYTRTSSGQMLRREPSLLERTRLLDRYYHPHHAGLGTAVRAELARKGTALIIDCHSFPSRPLPCDRDQTVPRPPFCIGTDDYHTPPALRELLTKTFHGLGYACGIDAPYAGTLVPREFLGKERRVLSVMIEVRRDLYLDESTGRTTSGFAEVRRTLHAVLATIDRRF